MTILALNAACQSTTDSIRAMGDQAESTARKITSIRDQIAAQKTEEAGNVLGAIAEGFYTQAATETYFVLLQADPNDPALNGIEYYVQRFNPDAYTLMKQLRNAARKAAQSKRRIGSKDKGLSADEFNSILSEITGGVLP